MTALNTTIDNHDCGSKSYNINNNIHDQNKLQGKFCLYNFICFLSSSGQD
jgi:hypothetical protein